MNFATVASWYEGLAERDRRVLRFGGIAAALIVLGGVLLPLQFALSKAREHLHAQQDDLAWMRKVGPTLAAAGPGEAVTVATRESLVVLIDSSAREAGLAQSLVSQPAGNGAMHVQLSGVDFNLLLGWLSRLASQHGVRVESASFTSNGAPGLVNATLQLRPPG